jgi:hypothetical protein
VYGTVLVMAEAAGPTASWPLLVVAGVVAALVAVVLVAQLTDPERGQRAAQRQALVGDAWRPRKVVRQIPPIVGRTAEEDAGAGESTATDIPPRPALAANQEQDAGGSGAEPSADGVSINTPRPTPSRTSEEPT